MLCLLSYDILSPEHRVSHVLPFLHSDATDRLYIQLNAHIALL